MTELPEGDGVSPPMRVGRCEVEQDLYAILGIASAATEADIRKALRRLALEHHPDRPGRSGEQMKRVNLAASVLLNASARARYDRLRSEGAHLRPSPGPAPRPRSVRPAARESRAASVRPTATRGAGVPFVSLNGIRHAGKGLSARLVVFALVATAAIGCVAQSTSGPVPVSSPSYRIPEPPRMASLWIVDLRSPATVIAVAMMADVPLR